MANRYFYRRGNTDFGPVSGIDLKRLVQAGDIQKGTLVRREDSDKWMPAGKSKSLFPDAEPDDETSNDATGFEPFVAGASSVLSAMKSLVPARKEPTPPTEPPPVPLPAKRVDLLLHAFINDGQNPAVVEKIHAKVTQILTSTETVEYIAVQAKPLVNLLPDSIVLTNRRFILFRQKILGQISFDDYLWLYLHDAKLTENIFGATISLQAMNGQKISVDYLPKDQARRIYRVCQEREEEVIEQRRARKMEESRAAAGGVYVQANVPATPTPAPATPAPPTDDPVAKLGQLKRMLDAGLIGQAEFDAKKTEILSRM